MYTSFMIDASSESPAVNKSSSVYFRRALWITIVAYVSFVLLMSTPLIVYLPFVASQELGAFATLGYVFVFVGVVTLITNLVAIVLDIYYLMKKRLDGNGKTVIIILFYLLLALWTAFITLLVLRAGVMV